jgi:hypothetical protein
MKFRISPLNFATAFFLVLAGYIRVDQRRRYYRQPIRALEWYHWLDIYAVCVVVSLLDIIFRNFFAETKKLWIVELSFITLVADNIFTC